MSIRMSLVLNGSVEVVFDAGGGPREIKSPDGAIPAADFGAAPNADFTEAALLNNPLLSSNKKFEIELPNEAPDPAVAPEGTGLFEFEGGGDSWCSRAIKDAMSIGEEAVARAEGDVEVFDESGGGGGLRTPPPGEEEDDRF